MKETAIAFGQDDGLVGIMSLPPAPLPPESLIPGLVFWNAGLIHRVGPARLYVILSRQFAAHGCPTIRFDLPGRGDSMAPTDAGDDRAQAVRALKAAMDTLAARAGVQRFVLVGLCSGADQAHAGAVADPRVVGFVAMDGYAYPTAGFWCRRIWKWVSNPYRVVGLLRRAWEAGVHRRSSARLSADQARDEVGTFDFIFPPREEVQRELEALFARRVQALFIYSGESGDTFNYPDQFRRMFPGAAFGATVEAVFLPDTDHLFALPGNGDQVVDLILAWITERFVAGVARQAAALEIP